MADAACGKVRTEWQGFLKSWILQRVMCGSILVREKGANRQETRGRHCWTRTNTHQQALRVQLFIIIQPLHFISSLKCHRVDFSFKVYMHREIFSYCYFPTYQYQEMTWCLFLLLLKQMCHRSIQLWNITTVSELKPDSSVSLCCFWFRSRTDRLLKKQHAGPPPHHQGWASTSFR